MKTKECRWCAPDNPWRGEYRPGCCPGCTPKAWNAHTKTNLPSGWQQTPYGWLYWRDAKPIGSVVRYNNPFANVGEINLGFCWLFGTEYKLGETFGVTLTEAEAKMVLAEKLGVAE